MATNEYGLDVDYFVKTVAREMASVKQQTPNDLARVFARLSAAADPTVMHEPEFTDMRCKQLLQVRDKAIELADVCENSEDLPLTKWALKCGRLVNELRKLSQ